MSTMVTRAHKAMEHVRGSGLDDVVDRVGHRVWSDTASVGFRRDLDRRVDAPSAAVSLSVVPLDATLAPRVFDTSGLVPHDRRYLEGCRSLWEAGLDGGWVALAPGGAIAHVQWFFPVAQADRVRAFYGPLVPELPDDTVFTDGAWVPPEFRGRGVMAEAMVRSGEAMRSLVGPRVRYAITYVRADNRGALHGVRAAGYEVTELRTEIWRLGACTVSFVPAHEREFEAFRRVRVERRPD